jgi:hypothetical protein
MADNTKSVQEQFNDLNAYRSLAPISGGVLAVVIANAVMFRLKLIPGVGIFMIVYVLLSIMVERVTRDKYNAALASGAVLPV